MFLSSCLLLPPATLRQSSGPSGSMGATLHRLRATATDARSLRASAPNPRSVRARRPSAAAERVTSPNASRGMASWETRTSETVIRPAMSLRDIQGQSAIRSRARFSAGFKMVGSAWSASGAMSPGTVARDKGGSQGSSPPPGIRFRTYRRSRSALPEVGRHTGAWEPASTPSRSRARKALTCVRASVLRACLSLTSSDVRTRTAAGSGPSPSRHRRLEKAERSATGPCLTTPTVLRSGVHHHGVQGVGPLQPQANGAGDVGDGGGQPVYGGHGVDPLHKDAPPLGRDGTGAQQSVHGSALVPGQPV